MKKLLITMAILAILPGISCNRCDTECGCGDSSSGSSYNYFSVSEYTVSPGQIYDSTSSKGIQSKLLQAPYQTDYRLLVLMCNAKTWYHACAPKTYFGMAAYACPPLPPADPLTRDMVTSITITSDSTFEPGKPPGTLLNEYFDVYWNSYTKEQTLLSLNSYSATLPQATHENFYFVLRKKPSIAQIGFTIKVEMKDGKSWNSSTPLLTLN